MPNHGIAIWDRRDIKSQILEPQCRRFTKIFVIIDKLSGAADLYGPAPQSSFDEARPSDRKFQRVIAEENLATIASRMEREIRFDPDLWIVAVEDRDGRTFFETI